MIYDPTPRRKKIMDALSQLVNVTNPFADHMQTTSNESVSGRAHRQGWKRTERVIDWLFRVTTGEIAHCSNSDTQDAMRAKATWDDYRARQESMRRT